MKRSFRAGWGMLAAAFIATVGIAVPVAADSMSSTSYKIDTSVAAPFGGQAGSSSYKMVIGGGEALNGSGGSASYKLSHGYVAQLQQSIQLNLTTASIALGTLTPGISKTGTVSAQVLTDAPSYSLSLAQNNNLTSGANTIPAISTGTIASPVAWVEGTTKGLGFTLTAAPSLPGKWGTAGNYGYAAIPSSTTTLYTRSGYTGGAQDTITVQPRVDISPSQLVGSYTNTITITATTIP
ncbi:hypothetical protein HY312_01640 [Candidatus Saccharibacteria bacterium]|nr:hypothetical protein [Candidatus Saccharibacteria bacterium]